MSGAPAATGGRVARLVRERTAALDDTLFGVRHGRYGLAVLRIGLGLIIAGEMLRYAPQRQWLWGMGATWQDTTVRADGYPALFDAFLRARGSGAFDLLYAALGVAGLLVALGWRTRWVTPFALVLYVSLWRLNTSLLDGDFALVRLLMTYLVLADAGAVWSMDARRRARRGTWGPVAWCSERLGWLPTLLHNAALTLVVYQVCVLYVTSSLFKVQGGAWQDGSALYDILQLREFQTWPSVNAAMLAHPALLAGMTYLTVLSQLFLPVLVLHRMTRYPALVVVLGMHVGIAVLMGLPFFSAAMIVADAVFIRTSSYQRMGRLADAAARRIPAPARRSRRSGEVWLPAPRTPDADALTGSLDTTGA